MIVQSPFDHPTGSLFCYIYGRQIHVGVSIPGHSSCILIHSPVISLIIEGNHRYIIFRDLLNLFIVFFSGSFIKFAIAVSRFAVTLSICACVAPASSNTTFAAFIASAKFFHVSAV